jgi:hypothetical protein
MRGGDTIQSCGRGAANAADFVSTSAAGPDTYQSRCRAAILAIFAMCVPSLTDKMAVAICVGIGRRHLRHFETTESGREVNWLDRWTVWPESANR